MDMIGLSLIFGGLVGLSLGLTGGGGAILAVPLLIYALAVGPQEAVGISLAAVGTIALIGALQRLRAREVDVRTGLLFAASGMVGAPIGSLLNSQFPTPVLLISFAVLMLVVAFRMWRRAAPSQTQNDASKGACPRGSNGELMFNTPCLGLLVVLGLLTGILSGLFGVGGGFIIVPALVLISGMPMRRAVATSLVVIALVSTAGVLSYIASGRSLEVSLTLLFIAGGIAGMVIGGWWSRRISAPTLQRGFAVGLTAVAGFVISQNVW